MAITISMVMLREDTPLSATDIQQQLTTKWPDLPPPSGTSEEDDTILFGVGSSQVILGRIQAPIPWSELEVPCGKSMLWENATAEVGLHQVHWIVTVMSEENPLAMSTLLSQVTAAVLASCPAAIGVYWGNASLVVPKATFVDLAGELPAEVPWFIWVDLQVGKDSATTYAGRTVGMAALGLMEFETHRSPESPRKIRQRFLSLGDYLLEHGPVIKDGDTFGADDEERVLVVYSKSALGSEGTVMRLEYQQQSSSKPWWKRW